MQTKLKVEFSSEGLCQDQGGCYWPVKKAGKGGMVLNSMNLPKSFPTFHFRKMKHFRNVHVSIFSFARQGQIYFWACEFL